MSEHPIEECKPECFDHSQGFCVPARKGMTGITVLELRPGQQMLVNEPGVLYVKVHNRLNQRMVIRVEAQEL
jgi:hypothetical protein